jgi:uncharacterized protein
MPLNNDTTAIKKRIESLNWPAIEESLHQRGWATTGRFLDNSQCIALSESYGDSALFRSRVVMARHNFGRGEYQYFSYPHPPLITALRESLYPPLSRIANGWQQAMALDGRFPVTLEMMLARCHAAGQTRPTPLLLKYEAGDYNCLHQDLYGEHVFPLQATVLLSEPGADFTGGEFVIVEQRPRMQSRPHVVPLQRGEAVIFAVHHRPVNGTRGVYRVNLRHGVSEVRSGHRFTAGIIFHDAT